MGSSEAHAQQARKVWQVAEAVHALIYFAPECHSALQGIGLKGFWRGYFAGRAAPLGPVGPGPAVAMFYGFHPDFVARALPDVWSRAEPSHVLEARLAGVDRALRRLFPKDADGSAATEWVEAADLLRLAFEGCSPAGRPLFAANLDLDWPDEPSKALWHGTTLLREHRGDGHVAALLVAGLDPCEAHVTQVAASGTSLDTIKPYRGWEDKDWDDAAERLRSRSLLDDEGRLRPDGRMLRQQVEDDTDRLAAEPLERLGPERTERLINLLRPIARHLAATGEIPYPNPIGVSPPGPAT